MLGRGLESLIPNKGNNKEEEIRTSDVPTRTPDVQTPRNDDSSSVIAKPPAMAEAIPYKAIPKDKGESVFQIEADKIQPNPHQPRRVFDEDKLNELAASIRELGIIQPLIVLKIEKEIPGGTEVGYQLIAGERRLRAAKIAGLERVPAIVRRVGQEKEKLEMAIVENVQRADLNPIEAARSYAKLQEEFGLTQREVASRVGKSRETVSNVLRLLNLPSQIQEAIGEGKISDSQGRLLLAISDVSQQNNLFNEIIRNNLTVRELRSKVERLKRTENDQPAILASASTSVSQDSEIVFMEEKLQELFGTKVSLQKTTDGGKIIISFFSPEEFQEIIKKIMPVGNQPS